VGELATLLGEAARTTVGPTLGPALVMSVGLGVAFRQHSELHWE
jgi:hypothetical protein